MNFRVPEALDAPLKARADFEHLSVQRLVEKAAEEYLNRHDKQTAIRVALSSIKVNYADALRRLGE